MDEELYELLKQKKKSRSYKVYWKQIRNGLQNFKRYSR